MINFEKEPACTMHNAQCKIHNAQNPAIVNSFMTNDDISAGKCTSIYPSIHVTQFASSNVQPTQLKVSDIFKFKDVDVKKLQFSWFPAGLLHLFLANIFPTHAYDYLHLP